eukprot:Sspe_Gene.112981::Locus_96847_Transcript_1_1_Confidence_1.000_Length_1146::g.112981::m.112981
MVEHYDKHAFKKLGRWVRTTLRHELADRMQMSQEMRGKNPVWVARYVLEIPGHGSFEITGEANGKQEAQNRMCMVGIQQMDHLGVPLHDDPAKQAQHLQTQRMYASGHLQAQWEAKQEARESQTIAFFMDFASRNQPNCQDPRGREVLEKAREMAYKEDLSNGGGAAKVALREYWERNRRHEGFPQPAVRAVGLEHKKKHIATLSLPIPGGYVAVGAMNTKRDAETRCYMHAAGIMSLLGYLSWGDSGAGGGWKGGGFHQPSPSKPAQSSSLRPVEPTAPPPQPSAPPASSSTTQVNIQPPAQPPPDAPPEAHEAYVQAYNSYLEALQALSASSASPSPSAPHPTSPQPTQQQKPTWNNPRAAPY